MEYVRLGNSGLKVSKIILGGMAFGSSQWEGSPWILDEEEGIALLKSAYDHGINTWDTADMYSNGKSEVIIGKALKKYNIPRQKVVIMSKIFNLVLEGEDEFNRPKSVNDGKWVNQMGLSRKHVFHAVDKCLERLQTDYIDVLQIHRLDRETSPEEIMCALNDLVRSGKVRYIGASSMYAWEFGQLQYTARSRGWAEFISMQPFYNLLYREEEREMIPFCKATGVAVIPWSPIARGLLARPLGKQEADGADTASNAAAAATSDAAAAITGGGAEGGQEEGLSLRSKTDTKTQAWFADANMEIVRRVEEVANNKGVSMALVSTAWVLHKGCWPIIGLSSEKRVKQIIEVFKVKLTDEEVAYLESEYKPRAIHGM